MIVFCVVAMEYCVSDNIVYCLLFHEVALVIEESVTWRIQDQNR